MTTKRTLQSQLGAAHATIETLDKASALLLKQNDVMQQQRDLARDAAVALEQENAELRRIVAELMENMSAARQEVLERVAEAQQAIRDHITGGRITAQADLRKLEPTHD